MTTTQPGSGRPRKVGIREATRILAERDPVIARMVADFGLPSFPAPAGSHFAALVTSITYQQLAGAAARAIHGRLVALLDDEVTPERILAATTEQLRAAGMSGNKTLSLQDLSAKVLDGTVVLEPRRLARLGDEEIVARLSAVRGIGKWSAEIFLMFQLRRLDVWPPATSASAGASPRRGRSRSRRPRCSRRSASRTTRTGPSSPGTAGGPPRGTPAPLPPRSPPDP